MEIVGKVALYGQTLDVYQDLDNPLFLASDIARMIDYSMGNVHKMLAMVEHDEKIIVSVRNKSTSARGNSTKKWFVTELGLYNVFSQSRKPIARLWRRVVHEELIRLRKDKDYTIENQFEEWDSSIDLLFYDEETDTLMTAITVHGGDVEIVPV